MKEEVVDSTWEEEYFEQLDEMYKSKGEKENDQL